MNQGLPAYRDLVEAVLTERPDLFPGAALARLDPSTCADLKAHVARGTTNIALRYADGIIIGADTRATMGMHIVDEHKNKVYPIDRFTAAAFAGLSALCDEYPGTFRIVFDNFRKINRVQLDFAGKANVISGMLSRNGGLHHGLIAYPLVAGIEPERDNAMHIISYDAVGGITEHRYFAAQGSGGDPAQQSMRKLWPSRGGLEMTADDAILTGVEALRDSALPQAGSAVPNLARGILPNLIVIDRDGARPVPQDKVITALGVAEQLAGNL